MRYAREFATLCRDDLPLAGGKGANLGELLTAGLAVPDGFVLTTAAYSDVVEANDLAPRIQELATGDADAIAALFLDCPIPAGIVAALRESYRALGRDIRVAVRSSATVEDRAEASFAGQQESFLNVRGDEAVLDAVRRCWASLWNPRAISYRANHGVTGDIALAVVVQRLVAARASGVMFTVNPLNGRTDETLVSAAWGLGEAVVSGAVTTDDMVVRESAVVRRTTAVKNTMTVLTRTGTTERPTSADQRDAHVLTDAQTVELARVGDQAAAHFGAPQDLEWVLDADGRFWIVQSRPITALGAESGPVPTEWPVPPPHDVFIRGSIVEQLPDPLSPLFGDMAAQLVVPGMIQTITDSFGPQRFFAAKDISFVTVNGFAYYGYAHRLMLKALAFTPMALRVAFTQVGLDRWRQEFHPRYRRVVESWRARDPRTLTGATLLDGITGLVGAGFAYYTSVQMIIPEAVTAEALFTRFHRLVKRPGDPRAEEFLLGFESSPIRADQSIYQLARWCCQHPALVDALSSRAALAVAPPGVPGEAWAEWQRRLNDHLTRYGHATYNLDLRNPVAFDDPAPVLDALRFYLSDEALAPAERRARLARRREAAEAQLLTRLTGVRRKVFRRLLARAQALTPVREDALADIGLGWPTARAYARELGARLVRAGALGEAEDVHWLRLAELTAAARAMDAESGPEPFVDKVTERRRTWRGQRQATPPAILPQRSVWHIFDSVMPTMMAEQSGSVLRGMGASGGQITGVARVLRGPEDFSGMQPGEILVAAITTPAWTPLFAMAGAVVTDVGGPLSHSSIVAREYGIPAVLGTTLATTRIRSGDRLAVDGAAGTVTLLDVPAS